MVTEQEKFSFIFKDVKYIYTELSTVFVSNLFLYGYFTEKNTNIINKLIIGFIKFMKIKTILIKSY